MDVPKSKLTRRELLASGASLAAIGSMGTTAQANAVASAKNDKQFGDQRFAVSVQPSAGTRISANIFAADFGFLGRVVYGGVWDRERNIPRADVKAAISALGTTAIRFPGSSDASMYHWRDGIGPLDKRPQYETTYWSSLGGILADINGLKGEQREKLIRQMDQGQTNQFGTDEFLQYCVDLGIEPVLSVNIGGGNPRGEGTPEEAAAWVRYCNVDRKSPRPVHWWQLGNELYGSHEPGHSPPQDYGKRIVELATAMRREDPSLKLIAVGTTPKQGQAVNPDSAFKDQIAMPFGSSWNRDVFSIAAEHVNAVSLTWGFPVALMRRLRDTESDGLQMTTGADLFGSDLDRVLASLDDIGGAAARLPLYLGEWGRQANLFDVDSDNHMLYDGIFFAGCFNKMIQRARRMAGAHMAHFINTTGIIQTEGDRFFVTSGYLVNQLYRWSCRREQAAVTVKTDAMRVPAMEDAKFIRGIARTDRQAPILDAAATTDQSGTTIYLTNRSLRETITVSLSGIAPLDVNAKFRYVTADSPYTRNTLDAPNAVRIAELPVTVKGGRAEVTIPPCTAGALIAGPVGEALVPV